MAASKKKIYFNFIDVLLLLAILASTVTLVFVLKDRRVISSGSDGSEVLLRVEITPLRKEFRNAVTIGDIVTDNVSQKRIGEVTDVSPTNCVYLGTNKTTGATVSSTYPDHVTLTLTIKAEAHKTSRGYEIGGRLLTIGDTLSLRVPDFIGTFTLLGVTPIAESPKT